MKQKGFTLIELLAVITIMGILMLVAIPAVSRTIENSRRDTFADNVVTYLNTVRNMVLADELKCGKKVTGSGASAVETWDYPNVSGTPDGTYYVKIDTSDPITQDMMESVAKSSWGNSDMVGYIKWTKTEGNTAYFAFMSDIAGHGMAKEQGELSINRGTVYANISAVKTCGDDGKTACDGADVNSVPEGGTECTLKY